MSIWAKQASKDWCITDVSVPEHLYVVDEAAAVIPALLSPQQARRVNDVPKHHRRRDIGWNESGYTMKYGGIYAEMSRDIGWNESGYTLKWAGI